MQSTTALLALVTIAAAQNPVFVQQPTSVNTTNGSIAVFTCSCVCTGTFWLVNGKVTNHQDYDGRFQVEGPLPTPDATVKTFLLKVPAEDINNNIEVHCSARTTSISIQSGSAHLRIQGLLDAVTNLTANQINSTAVQLQFTAPNSLEGVPFSYQVRAVPNNGAPVITKIFNSTSDETIMEPLDLCAKYTISVTSVNGAGLGGVNSLPILLNNMPVERVLETYNVWFATTEDVMVYLNLSVNTSCAGEVPDNFTLELTSSSDAPLVVGPCPLLLGSGTSPPLQCPSVIVNSSNELSGLITLTSPLLKLHTHYMIRSVTSNNAGVSTSGWTTIRTSYVTHASVEYISTAGVVCIECSFTGGSYDHMVGCKAVLRNIATSLVAKTIFVPKRTRQRVSDCEGDVPSGVYQVDVYDTDSSGSALGEHPVFVITTSITVPIKTNTPITSIATPGTSQTITESSSPVRHTMDSSVPIALSIGVAGAVFLVLLVVIVVTACFIRIKKKANIRADPDICQADPRVYTPGNQTNDGPVYDNPTVLMGGATNPMHMKLCEAYSELPLKK